MPTIAHLILGHCQPDQLARLARRLNHPDATIFVHIDKKYPLDPFHQKLAPDEAVKFIQTRRSITWGGYSMVQATLTAFREMLSGQEDFDFINLLSESDYPLKSASSIHKSLAQHLGKSFMEFRFRGDPWWEEAQSKIEKYHFTDVKLPGRYTAERIVNLIAPRRSVPDGMLFTGRSQWFTLATNHAKYILDVVDNRPDIDRFFKYTWGADEFFFQTLLFNSPHRDDLVNDSLRYTRWLTGKASPEILTRNDFKSIAIAAKYYARKFSLQVDAVILDMIDEHLLD